MNFKNSKAGFTLVELLIYSSLFVVIGGLVTGIALNIKKNADINNAQRTVDAAFNDLSQRLGAAISEATAVDNAANGILSLISPTSNLVNTFTLSNGSVSYSEAGAAAATITPADVSVDLLNFKITPPSSVGIDPINHWAYNDVFGWIDFGQTGNSIKIPTGGGDLTGVAWGKGSGYVF